jgi:hypothetical protein
MDKRGGGVWRVIPTNPGGGFKRCTGQDFTRQPLHQGILSSDKKEFWKSFHKRSISLFRSYPQAIKILKRFSWWQGSAGAAPFFGHNLQKKMGQTFEPDPVLTLIGEHLNYCGGVH